MGSASKPSDSLAGTVLEGAYEILGVLAGGGMGTVHEAVNLRLNKRVAIKVIASELAGNVEAVARFRREAEVTSAMGHPHIVQVFDFGATPTGEPFLVMEYLEGEDLEHRLHRVGTLSARAILHIVKQVASALAASHGMGVVHRDLKPSNIFLLDVAGETDFVKVLDFGVSKVRAASTELTQPRKVVGTPKYMSPEQAKGLVAEIDGRTDLWALACIVWEALSGEAPFVGEDDLSLLYQVVYEAPRIENLGVDSLPPKVEQVLRQALSKQKDDRFPNVMDFFIALEDAIFWNTREAKASDGSQLAAPVGKTLLGSPNMGIVTPGLAASPPAAIDRLRVGAFGQAVERGKRILDRILARAKWKWLLAVSAAVVLVLGAFPLFGPESVPEEPQRYQPPQTATVPAQASRLPAILPVVATEPPAQPAPVLQVPEPSVVVAKPKRLRARPRKESSAFVAPPIPEPPKTGIRLIRNL